MDRRCDRPPARWLPAPSLGWATPACLAVLLLVAPAAAGHAGGGLGGSVETRVGFPSWLVWVAGAAIVGLTFALVGAFLSRPGAIRDSQGASVEAAPLARGNRLLQGVGLLLLAVVGLNGLVPGSGGLLPEVSIWLIAWAGLPLVAYLVLDPGPHVSPFRAIGRWIETRRSGRPPLTYPDRLASWPAVVALIVAIGLEVWGGPWRDPTVLGRLVLGYTGITLSGMVLFGSHAWLDRVELLDRMLAWWATLAPVHWDQDGWQVAWPGTRLGDLTARGPGEVGFVVALLYGVNFDGFLATGPGQGTLTALAGLGAAGSFIATLVAGYGVFLAAFWTCAWAVARVADTLRPVSEVAGRFAVSLIPIAAGYHLAHDLFYLAENLPVLVEALGDPLGLGWTLLPAVGAWSIPPAWSTAVVGAQVALIVLGHILAVVAAHHAAFGTFPSRIQAIKSEVPLALVMVFYTMVGLWIVSLPGVTP